MCSYFKKDQVGFLLSVFKETISADEFNRVISHCATMTADLPPIEHGTGIALPMPTTDATERTAGAKRRAPQDPVRVKKEASVFRSVPPTKKQRRPAFVAKKQKKEKKEKRPAFVVDAG